MYITNDIGITVKEMLELDSFRGTKVVAGREGIDKVVSQVNVMEVPDIADWVGAGELLLTTTYSIKDNPEALKNLIPRLAQRNLAGLAIKTGRYIEQIPDLMIEQADELGFPLLELPYEVSFADLIKPVLNEILNLQADFLQTLLDVHEKLMNVVLEGGGLQAISEKLSFLVKNPIAIVDSEFKLLSFSSQNCDLITLANLVDNDDIDEDDLHKNKLANYYLDGNLIRKDELIGRFKKTEIEIKGETFYQMSIPIMSGQQMLGHIFVWEACNELKDVDLLSIERSATVAALEMINQQAIFEVERRYRNELLFDILSGKFDSKTMIIERANAMDWDLSRTYSVLVFELADELTKQKDNQGDLQDLRSKILAELNLYLESFYSGKVILGDKGSSLVLLYSVQDLLNLGMNIEKIRQEIKELVAELLKIIKRMTDKRVVVGVGNFYKGVDKLQKSYEEAESVIKVASTINQTKEVFFFEDLGVYRLIYNLTPKEIDSFLQDTIIPLVEYDKQHNTEFIETLEEYFICNGNLKKMSDRLFLHYNSVLYRIERIQEITGLDLDDREERLSIEMGLKLLDFYYKSY